MMCQKMVRLVYCSKHRVESTPTRR